MSYARTEKGYPANYRPSPNWPPAVPRARENLYLQGHFIVCPLWQEVEDGNYRVGLEMKRERLFGRLEGEWASLMESFYGLSDSALNQPGAVGHWSIRDLLGHITTWENEALISLPVILEGKPLPRYASSGGIDAFNAREQDRKRRMTLVDLNRDLAATHERLIAYVESVPETDYAQESRFLKRLRQDTYGHYREHTNHVLRWRTEQNVD